MTQTDQRVALVTGAATGIGLASAQALARAGATVYVGARDVEKAESAIRSGPQTPGALVAVGLDVRDPASVEAAFEAIDRGSGRLDILVNNAGVNCIGRVDEVSEADWDACLDTNLKGPFLCARAAIPLFRRSGGGVVVNVASNAGLVARGDEPAYSTSKAGLIMLTRALAVGHAVDRIRVNAVCPGPVGHTDMMDRALADADDPAAALQGFQSRAPLAEAYGRLIDPTEVAELVSYLCSEAAAMVTGAVITIDAGKSAGLVGQPPNKRSTNRRSRLTGGRHRL